MLLEAIITVVIALSLPLVLKWYHKRFYYDAHKIPGPPGIFLLGNIFDLGSTIEEVFQGILQLCKTYGPIIRFWQGPTILQVMISEPEYMEKLLASNVHLNKGFGYNGFEPWLGNSILISEAKQWRRQRKLLTPTFHFKILEQFFDVYNSASNILVNALKNAGLKGPVNLPPFLKLYGMDTICETSMGIKINAQLQESKDFVMAVEDFMEAHMVRYFSLLKKFDWYYRFFEVYQRQQRAIKILKDTTRNVIENRIKERAKYGSHANENLTNEFGIKKKTALLDLLLDVKDSDAVSEQEVNDHVNTFLFGGHDTISSVLSFCLFQIAKSPDMQKRIIEEIHTVIGESKEEPITMQHVQELTYTERFLKEVMRMYTPVPFVERTLSDTLEIGGYKLPKDTNITFLIYAMLHNPKYFPDPEKFDPDRFLPDNSINRNVFAYIPFSAGPRNCIGQRFAMHQLKATLANIIRNLDFSAVVPEHKLRLANDSILKSLSGVYVNVRERK